MTNTFTRDRKPRGVRSKTGHVTIVESTRESYLEKHMAVTYFAANSHFHNYYN